MIVKPGVRSLCLALLGLLAAAATPAYADSGAEAPGWQAGGGLIFGDGLGQFGRAAGEGFGLSAHFVAAPWRGPLGLRVQVAALNYGSETLPAGTIGGSNRVRFEVTTDNWYANLVAGPQLMARSGPVRPYLNLLGGFSYFGTTSELRGERDIDGFASTTNFDDWTFAWSAGGGVIVPLGGRVALDLGARYLGNSTVDYLTEGDLFEDVDGTLVIEPRRSEANLIEVTLGVSFDW